MMIAVINNVVTVDEGGDISQAVPSDWMKFN